jgi:hypothetical protein
MAQQLEPWEREKLRHEIEFNSARKKLISDGEKLITLTTQVEHQSQTIDHQKTIIETLTKKINTCERFNTQLIETNNNLRANITALRRKCTESDAENFQLRHAYQYLQQEYDELNNSYLENVQKLRILENSLTR